MAQWLAGETITAARLSQDSGSTSLTDDTAAAIDTWEDWGTETITFTDPGVAVKVKAWLNGRIFNIVDANSVPQARISISFDGGTIFEDGPTTGSINIGTGSGTQTRSSISALQHKSGTPTGSIVVKAMLRTDDLSANFSTGVIMAEVIPQ